MQRVHHAVPWTSITSVGIVAGLLVQLVDVLGDDAVQLAGPLDVDDRPMAGVRLRRPQRRDSARIRQAVRRTSGSAR